MHVMEEACQGTEQGAPHQPPEILRHLCPLSRISSKMSPAGSSPQSQEFT